MSIIIVSVISPCLKKVMLGSESSSQDAAPSSKRTRKMTKKGLEARKQAEAKGDEGESSEDESENDNSDHAQSEEGEDADEDEEQDQDEDEVEQSRKTPRRPVRKAARKLNSSNDSHLLASLKASSSTQNLLTDWVDAWKENKQEATESMIELLLQVREYLLTSDGWM